MAKKLAKQNLSYSSVKLGKDVSAYPTYKLDNQKGYVKNGSKNDFPISLLELVISSPTASSIIKSKIQLFIGDGVKGENDGYVGEPNNTDTWDEFLEKIAQDYLIFNAFAFQVILNHDEKTVSIFHQDYSTLRCSPYDENGVIPSWYMSNNFTKSNIPPIELVSWNYEEPIKGKPYIFVYEGYIPNLDYYTLPEYYGALNYLSADSQLGVHMDNAISNNFLPSSIITMPNNPDEEERLAFERTLQNTYTGAESSNSLMVLWNQTEENGIKINNFEGSSNSDRYNNLDDKIKQSIYTAMRISSPTLASVPSLASLGGAGNEIITSYILYNFTVIKGYRKRVLGVINKFVRRNFNTNLVIKELPLIQAIKEAESTTDKEDVIEDINKDLDK